MPVSVSASASTNRPEDLIERLKSSEGEAKLKALKEVKNQIIGNRTKKLSYIKLGAVPIVVGILADAAESDVSLLVQSAAAIGSFACGVDAGVKAVLDSGAFPHLFRTLHNPDAKVVDAGARSLRMIFQSKLAPKYDFLEGKNMEFLLSLLNSENENVTGLGASIITHSCDTSVEQKALCDAGVLLRLSYLLEGSLNQRDASLDSLATIVKNNYDVISKFVELEGGTVLHSITELTKDRNPRTRLLSCICLIVVGNAFPCCLQDIGTKTKLILILVELLDEPDQVGDEAPFALANLIADKEDLQKLAFEVDAVDKLCNFLHKGSVQVRRLHGILLALSELCSKMEICRSRFLSLQVLNVVADAMSNDSLDVRIAACICLRNIARSVKNLSAGRFMNEMIVTSLVQLLSDPSTSVQVAALGAISNIVVDFTSRKSIFIQCGGVKELVRLSRSMDFALRLNSVWALRNLMFLADKTRREDILLELTSSTLASLVCDPEPLIQEQSLALVRNLADGCINCIEHVLADNGIIINAVGRQLWCSLKSEVCIQGMYMLGNVATGNEFHKETVMHQLLPPEASECSQSFVMKFLQNNDSRLRTAAVWCVVNLTYPDSPGASDRIERLQNAGIISQIKKMVNDPCLDAKFRVRTVLEQCVNSQSSSA
ncbi:armadillo repeat-containing protein 8-like [Telopea speciosissima]|uniref:armadillo repeat-containing protein 8-like n=1 Tax=Telopea speciosissima TaxID=54955 RepID=UPI001CC60F2F|nr:armadillo repeat-containing protein 8-like [Telopea speciosissima]